MMIFLFENFDTFDNEKWTLIATIENTNRRFVEKLIISVFESYQNAIDDFVWNKLWFEIIQIELTTLIVNEIWDVVVSFKNVNIVINKWIFKIKMHVNDTLNKLKIKLVARDFSQMYEIDYTNIFVSIVKFDTFRLFFVVVILKNLECHQMNVNNAFTKSFLKKIIYMKFSSNVDLFLNKRFWFDEIFMNWNKRLEIDMNVALKNYSKWISNRQQLIFAYFVTKNEISHFLCTLMTFALSSSHSSISIDSRMNLRRCSKSRIWKKWRRFLILESFAIAKDELFDWIKLITWAKCWMSYTWTSINTNARKFLWTITIHSNQRDQMTSELIQKNINTKSKSLCTSLYTFVQISSSH